MKLFYFNPNNFGQQYFVCAESKEKAIEAVKKSILDNFELQKANEIEQANKYKTPVDFSSAEHNKDYYLKGLQEFVDNKNGCTIDELEPGQVVSTEIA